MTSDDDLDKNTFSKRIKRYTTVTSAVSGTAMRMIGERFLGFDVDHEQQAQALTQVLGSLKGPVMKIAQLLATVPDAIPQEYMNEFLSLQSSAPAMGWPFVKRRMKSELGPDWQSKFKHFDRTASAAASLGQVHKAIHHDGSELACKLQYPDMRTTVEADLNQLKMALKLYESTMKAIKTSDIQSEIAERLQEELDYTLEAQNTELYQKILANHPHINVPTVYPELSTDRLLTMSWQHGHRLHTILDRSQEEKNHLARVMFRAWYAPFYHYGVIHGDPHLGNYTFTEDGCVNLLDFGCIRKFPPNFVMGVLMLYEGLSENDSEKTSEAYRMWGFTNLTQELLDTLNIWAQLLYEPLMDDSIRPIQKDQSGAHGREAAAKVHAELRRLGGVNPPREFVFMDRAAVGMGSVFMHLGAQLNWHEEFHTLIKDVNHDLIQQNQSLVGLYR